MIKTGIRQSQAFASRVPFRDGFLSGDLASLTTLRLAGSRCQDCGVSLFGERLRCENCSSKNVKHEAFARNGAVYSYTIQRYPPPKPNATPDPWRPRPLAWIDLANNGPRILSPVDCSPEAISIGAAVRLRCDVAWLDAHEREVVAYTFVLHSHPTRD